MGGSFAYAYENNKSGWHYPVAFLAPVTYGSYHMYRNRDMIFDASMQASKMGRRSLTPTWVSKMLSGAHRKNDR